MSRQLDFTPTRSFTRWLVENSALPPGPAVCRHTSAGNIPPTKMVVRVIFSSRVRPLFAPWLPINLPRVHRSVRFWCNKGNRDVPASPRQYDSLNSFATHPPHVCETPVRLLNSSPGDEAGLRSVMAFVEGESAYGWLRPEAGVHRLVRNSPYDPTGRRHTSFSQVRIFPEADSGSGEKTVFPSTPTVRVCSASCLPFRRTLGVAETAKAWRVQPESTFETVLSFRYISCSRFYGGDACRNFISSDLGSNVIYIYMCVHAFGQ